MILKNLTRRSVRSGLTLLGIAIGVAAVVALGSIAEGITSNFALVVGGSSNDLLITQAEAMDPAFSSIDETVGERLLAVPGVERVEPGVYTWVTTPGLPFFFLFGYEIGSTAMDHYRVVEGKPVSGPGQMVIGRRATESIDISVGDNLRIHGTPFRVVGIYETGQGIEESGGVVTLEDAQTAAQFERKVSLYEIGLRRGEDASATIERIESLDLELKVSKTSERESNQQYEQMMQGFAWGIAAIAIFIGGLGMMNSMVMSVLERTREIGTLRALGWSRWRVLWIILGESMALSAAGGVVGVLMGIGLAKLAGTVPGMGVLLQGAFTPAIIIQGLVTALFLGLVGGVYPAWRAAGLRPVEALSYEGGTASDFKPGLLSRIGSQSFRNLWRRRNRTLLAAAGIGIGVGTLVMLGGLTTGLIGQMNNLAGTGSPGNITVMQRDVPDLSLSSVDERVMRQIQGMPQVESVSPMVLGFVLTPELPLFFIFGLEPNSAAMDHYKLTEGRRVQRPSEIIIGSNAADSYDLELGDTMTLYNNRYRVVGIFETGVAWEEGGGILALRESQRILNRPRNVSFLFVDVKDPAMALPVQDAINQRFPKVRASISSEFAQSTDDIASMQGIAGAIGMLALIVGGIVVANTMIMSIYERTREIGTLRALGWPGKRILSQIVQESLLLCLLSALLGSIGAVALLTGLSSIPFAGGAMLRPAWEPGTFVISVGLAILLGLIGGFYPAWRASRLQPVEALRYE
ncbi:MAG: ABC transporter permease [Caldilineaceae bacterium SB0664_bin_27]|uniref:ABC transporter permease n=1 Tax=Caldilineaceae bacterium SB0664_bin_27 TaxID=2605260 RepID=A0A6B0YYZ7_9CHLR|nr:ABC transporter permease [Caldilineaceae bacterium SB0664_bin_27]